MSDTDSSRSDSGFNPKTKIWSGPVVEDCSKQVAIGEVIRSSLRKYPNNIGQICANSGIALTNEEILLRSLKIAYYLTQKFKLTQNDVVSIVARNTENLAPLVFGLLNCGLSINVLDCSFDRDEIVNLFEYIKPKIVFCDADKYTVVCNALKALHIESMVYIVSENIDQLPTTTIKEILTKVSTKDAWNFSPIDPTDLETHAPFIICSSGTGGTSKGVCVPHSYFLVSESVSLFGATSTILSFSSLYWVSGWVTLLIGTINGMTRIICDEPFSPELWLRLIEQYKIGLVVSPPSQMALITKCPDITKRDLSSLKVYICGGSAVSSAMCNEFQKIVPQCVIVIFYGTTEIGQIAKMAYSNKKMGSVGKVISSIQVKIIDESGAALGPNQHGEICLKTKHRFLRYYGRPNDTALTLDADDWVHTGDVGYMDEDGFLFVVDRKKEIMKYKNFHVSPSELEIALGDLAGVKRVCVCGIPDPVYTDLPVALIVRDNGADIREEDVHEFMKANFSDHKQLRGGVYFVDSLPETPSGKIRLLKAKELAVKLFTEGQKLK